MKQVKVKFPAGRAEEVATALYEIGFNTIVSHKDDDFFGDGTITLIGVFPEDKADEFKTKFSKYIIK